LRRAAYATAMIFTPKIRIIPRGTILFVFIILKTHKINSSLVFLIHFMQGINLLFSYSMLIQIRNKRYLRTIAEIRAPYVVMKIEG
jgi:hypothetical protein